MDKLDKYLLGVALLSLLLGCEKGKTEGTLFELLPETYTRISFSNELKSTNDFNIYKYRNFYNGAGVGLGDVNNDGLLDIYLTANMETNKLFINKGNLVFEDMTEKAGVAGKRAWSTGVAMVDINADGWLDIYVCNSGDVAGDNKQNEFFINNGDGTFTDKAEEMGLADRGFSTHAVFFDYDKDGDLDMYQLNNSYRSIGSFNLQQNERPIRDSLGGDKLYRNDGGTFSDVGEEAGVYGSIIGFGLGVAVADFNRDGWQDFYVANDFFERDYLYMNNGDGTFSESLTDKIKATSLTSMGVDAADLTGDGYPEIFVNDMLPQTNDRFKTSMTFENWDKYWHNLKNDYYHQFTRNTLQLNLGKVEADGIRFSEVARYSGVEATDWSWSVLLADFDNSGTKDVYITNGIYQDILDQDFIQFIANEEVARMVIKEEGVDYKQLIDFIPSEPISNYAYSGKSNLRFEDVSDKWGLNLAGSSSGAAYGDLDNDGDLDLVVNNVNQPLSVYRNGTDGLGTENYLKVKLVGDKKNVNALGAQVTLKMGEKVLYQEQHPNRGFQSSVDHILHFGLGDFQTIDSLLVDWPYGTQTVLVEVKANQLLELNERDASKKTQTAKKPNTPIFQEIMVDEIASFKHRESVFVDFDKETLIYHMNSTQGPKVAIADVNNDGQEDIYIGGAKNQSGQLFLGNGQGFSPSKQVAFEKDKAPEDVECLFFDADGDGDQDLYVTSGSSEFGSASFALVDRLYINDGKGVFSNSGQSLPVTTPQHTSTVASSDFDKDGDIDLFVGTRMNNNAYGVPVSSFLLQNDGQGRFTNATSVLAKELENVGMVTDALWVDLDQDQDDDLIVIGEWMGIKLFENREKEFVDISVGSGLSTNSGWWNVMETADLNNDGFPDFIVGNHGLNSRFRASEEKPLHCYINDFDANGDIEQLICQYNGEKQYPTALRHDLTAQLPGLKKQILKYEDYKGKTIHDLFSEEVLKTSIVHHVTHLESVVLLSKGKMAYEVRPLPWQTQLTPIYAVEIHDFDGDGHKDIVLGGNLYRAKPEVGRYDAAFGVFLKGDGKGDFEVIPLKKTGLVLDGEIRDLRLVDMGGKKRLLVARNNNTPQIFEFKTDDKVALQ